MNSKRRSASWSYPDASRWQREQIVAEPLRGRTWALNTFVVGTEASLMIDKSPEVVAAVQDRD
jgi:hypothetical protein